MAILSSLRASRPTLSFEFFPPKNDSGSEDLLKTVTELGKLDPAFVSVTYGAGGTTRERTREVVQRIIQDTNVPTIPHLTCIGHTKSEMSDILSQYSADKVGTILALRVTPPAINQIMTGARMILNLQVIWSLLSKNIQMNLKLGWPVFQKGIRERRTGSPKWIILNLR